MLLVTRPTRAERPVWTSLVNTEKNLMTTNLFDTLISGHVSARDVALLHSKRCYKVVILPMKFSLSVFVCLLTLLNLQQANAQAVIEKLSFANALIKAGVEGKILMVVMDSRLNKQANKTTSEVLYNPAAFTINKQAVIIRPVVSGTDWEELVSKYYQDPNLKSDAIGGLFFNAGGELVHRYFFASNNPNAFFNQAFLAKRIADMPNEKVLADSLKSSGYTNINLLSQLLTIRRERSQTTDDLLESFISATPVDSFKSFRYFQALARLYPILHTRADSILRSSNFSTNCNMLEINERADIFHNINNKTSEKAVAEKDYALARYLIDSTDNNNLENVPEKDKPLLRAGLMSNFYSRVNDTAAYILSAIDYADNYLMKLKVDSVNKAFAKSIEALKKRGKPFVYKNDEAAARYGSQLNFNAWQFYKMTDDTLLLLKALGWIKRAVEFNATPEALGAYALLLYNTGNRAKAINNEKKLIRELKNLNRYNEVPKCERILARMKSSAEKADE